MRGRKKGFSQPREGVEKKGHKEKNKRNLGRDGRNPKLRKWYIGVDT